jgi:hypothetical protein
MKTSHSSNVGLVIHVRRTHFASGGHRVMLTRALP